jgi:hypothetical protein
MKSIISKSLAMVTIAVTLLSFSINPPKANTFGGEGFEIYLNGKVVLQQFGKNMNTVKNLQLSAASPGDKLTIRYHHCGRTGKNRIITVRDGEDKLIKEWRFSDAKTTASDMSCSVKDFIILKKGSNNIFKLYYSSSELPNGRQLASVTLQNTNTVQL